MSWSSYRTNFDRSIAVVIGINDYQNGIHPLSTPVNDANVLANLLKTEYEYQEMVCLFPPYKEATQENINELLKETLPNQIRPTQGDRLLFYFAGHGIARNSEDGPAGYLIPQNAQLGKLETFLPMRDLNAALSQLDCHHLLVILDCCFAGNFRWSSARNVCPVPETIHREHYDRFIRCSAWQAITSAAYNQEALDFLSDSRVQAQDSHHSPFALALIEGLKDNKADLTGDGVITAPELYLYLRDRLISQDGVSELQTPGLWPLQKHDRGEFIFTLPGFKPEQLTPAPPLNKDNNPYRGLQPFNEKHARFFFGRQELVSELYKRISQFEQSSELIIVVGISGSGKSSLVKAGLIPYLHKNYEKEWQILKPMRPGISPFIALATTLLAITNVSSDAASEYVKQLSLDLKKNDSQRLIDVIAAWSQANSQVKLLLTIDQFEELITMSRKVTPVSSGIEPDSTKQKLQRWLSKVFRRQLNAKNNNRPKQKDDVHQEWQQFLALLVNTLKHCPQLYVILTLRSDFEPRLIESAFKDYWNQARFPVRAMRSDELREAIEKPASEMALYFEPANLVDWLIDEVREMPGALPLLSFTLSELYIKLHQAWVKEGKTDRALTIDDNFFQQGGIACSLTNRADEIYNSLPDDAHRATMRRVMLRMVSIEGSRIARRRVPESELVYSDETENKHREQVINRFVNARLLVKGQEIGEIYVEPSHDFLVRGWDKLQKWIEQEQQILPLQQRLTSAALDWEKKKNAQFLWNANPYLDVLKVKVKSTEKWFNKIEAEFVQQSVLQKRKNTTLRWSIATGVILGLSVFSIITLIGQRQAQIDRTRALRETAETNLRSNLGFDALLESLQAVNSLKQPLLEVFKPDHELQTQVRLTLQKAVYQVKELNRLEGHEGSVPDVSFSPDGQQLASGGDDGTVRFWNLQGQQLKVLKKAHKGIIRSISFSPDGQQLVTGGDDGIARLWDLQSYKMLAEFPHYAGKVWSVSFSPNQKQLATGGEDNTVRLWNLQGQPVAQFTGDHQYAVLRISFSPDGHRLATGNDRGTVRLWDIQSRRQLAEFKTHQSQVWGISFSPDGQRLATAGYDGTVRLWDLQSRQQLAELKPHEGSVWSVSFSPDGKQLATGDDRGTVRLWDSQSHRLLTEFKGHQGAVWKISFNPNSQKQPTRKVSMATAGIDGTIRLWNWQPRYQPKFKENQEKVKSISVSLDEQRLATGDEQGFVRLWNLQDMRLLAKFKEPQTSIGSMSLSPDGKQLAVGNDVGTVCLWNLHHMPLVKQCKKMHFTSIRSISFSPNGQRLATAGKDFIVQLWNLQDQKLKFFQHDDRTVNAVSFSPDGQQLASAAGNKTVLWNLQNYQVLATFPHQDFVNSISFNPNRQQLATGDEAGFVYLWDLQGKKKEKPFRAHPTNSVEDLSFSRDGQQLATAGKDGSVRLWNSQHQQLAEFTAHSGETLKVSFIQNGKQLVTMGKDKIVKLWNIESFDELLSQGCTWVGDYLENRPQLKKDNQYPCEK